MKTIFKILRIVSENFIECLISKKFMTISLIYSPFSDTGKDWTWNNSHIMIQRRRDMIEKLPPIILKEGTTRLKNLVNHNSKNYHHSDPTI